MSARRVVITGLGAVTPVGNDLKSTWDNLCNGVSGIDKIKRFSVEDQPCQIGGEIKNFNPEDYYPAKELKRYDRYSVFALVAAQEAVSDAGLDSAKYCPTKKGCILGVGIGGLDILEENHKSFLEGGPRKVTPFLIPAMIGNLAPGNVAIKHGLEGVNYTITSACTSGTHAMGESYRMIRDGLQDVVVTGGAESAVTPLGYAGFGRMKALSTRNDDPQKASRPFDKDRDGFVMGEGAAVLVLEEYEAAKARGAKIYAEVVGYGFSCDAHHITAPKEGGEGAVQCMKDALVDAKMNPEDVGYINAHGTSTPVNDPAETAAIKSVFGSYAKEGLVVSSTKSMTGHLLGAAGGLEGLICAKSLSDGIIPPTINLDAPDENCDLDYVPHTARDLQVEATMSNSFGFGGTNASVILKRVS